METKLNISCQGNSNWIYPILNKLNDSQRAIYKKSDLRELGISISTKLDMINYLVEEINAIILKLNIELKEDSAKIKQYLNESNIAYPVKNQKDIFILLAYMESVIFEMDSTKDLTIHYCIEFFNSVINDKINEKRFIKLLNDSGLPDNWLTDLNNIRNDLIHNYAGWLTLYKNDESFRLAIELPEIKLKKHKKHDKKEISDADIRNLFKGFKKFLKISSDQLCSNHEKNTKKT